MQFTNHFTLEQKTETATTAEAMRLGSRRMRRKKVA
jgi:hypothetical protein